MTRYRIVTDTYTIYDTQDKNTYPVIKPVLEDEMNGAGTLTFTVIPGHPHYNQLKKMQTFITAYRDNEELFYGRILGTDRLIDDQLEVTCEGGLTFFLDTELAGGDHKETIAEFLTRAIQEHNSQVEAAKQFTLGMVSPKAKYATDKYDFNLSNYTVTKNALEQLVLNRFGGYFRVRPNPNGAHFLDYIEVYGRENTQPISIGHNIEDKSDHISGENIFTILRPIARVTKKVSGRSGTVDLTIEKLTQDDVTLPNVIKDGKVLKLSDKIELYGNIVHTEQFENVTTDKELLEAAEEYISRHGTQLQASISITYVDFYHLNKNLMDVRLGDTFTTIDGFDGQTLTVGEISIDMEDPANDTITLKNDEELNGGRGDSYGSAVASSRSLSDVDAFRYKYIHEDVTEQKQLILATREIQINGDEKIAMLSNQITMTVEERQGQPGQYKIVARRHANEDPSTEFVLDIAGMQVNNYGTLSLGDGTNWKTTGELSVSADRISQVVQAVGENGEVHAASIVAAINQQTGQGIVKIEADKVDVKASDLATWGVYTNDTLTAGVIAEKLINEKDTEYRTRFGTFAGEIIDAGAVVSKIVDDEGKEWKATFGTYINGKLDAGVMVNKIVDEEDTRIQAKFGTYVNGKLDAGIMVEKINDDTTTTISGDRVNLEANDSFNLKVGGNEIISVINNAGTTQGAISFNKLNIKATDIAGLGFYNGDNLTAGILVEKLSDGKNKTLIKGDLVNLEANNSFSLKVGKSEIINAINTADGTQGTISFDKLTIDASKLNLNANTQFTAKVGKSEIINAINTADGTQGTISFDKLTIDASKLNLNANTQFTAKVGKSEIINAINTADGTQGTIKFDKLAIDASKLDLTANSDFNLKVGKGNVISSINASPESITIKANKINLQGYVTADQLSAELADFDAAIADGIVTSDLQSDDATITRLKIGSDSNNATWQSLDVVTAIYTKEVHIVTEEAEHNIRVLLNRGYQETTKLYYLGHV